MFFNILKFIFETIFVTTLLIFYTLFALNISKNITDYIFKNKYIVISTITFLSIVVGLLYILKVFILKKYIHDNDLIDTSFIIVGPSIAVYTVLAKVSHLRHLVKDIFFKYLIF